jgi:hypothetical protein
MALETQRVQNLKTAQEARVAQTSADYQEQLVRSIIQSNLGSAHSANASANESETRKRLNLQSFAQNALLNPQDIRRAKLQNDILDLSIPGLKNEADFQRWIGPYAKGIGTAREAAGLLANIKNLTIGR